MIRWSYGINTFKPQFDDLVRRRDQERALRVISISGFEGVELASGTGRWEALGNPQQLASNFRSIGGFAQFVRDAALTSVSSWVWDPAPGQREDLTGPANPVDPASHAQILRHAEWYGDALAELGGSVLVARPAPSAWQQPELTDEHIASLAHCWNAVGGALASRGIKLGLHFDFVSALRVDDGLERLVAATDPGTVGFTLDTGEYAVAGLDPVAWYREHADRVVHVQLKGATAADDQDEFTARNAEHNIRRGGGKRGIHRWFVELGIEPNLVDGVAMVDALRERDYDGWVAFESDLSPHPSTSVMLNGWYLQNTLNERGTR